MDSKNAQHNDGSAVQEMVPATPAAASMLAPGPVLAASMHLNQHSGVRANLLVVPSQRGLSFNGMSREMTHGGENFVVVGQSLHQGDMDCTAVRYNGGGLDVILSVQRCAGRTFKRATCIVRHEGTEGQEPIIRLFRENLSKSAHEWVRDFVGQIMERMCANTRIQMSYNVISISCSAVCSNSALPRLVIYNPFYLGTAFHPKGQSASISELTVRENDHDEYPPWEKLELDCCHQILDQLDAFSTLNFALVCKTWKGVYTENPRLQPGSPTLLTSPSLDGGWDIPNDVERGMFFVQNIILSRETFSIELDSFGYCHWIGGKGEWLVTIGRDSANIVNPITGAWTPLLPDEMMTHNAQRVQLCQTPADVGSYFAIAISSDQLAYTMDESDQWIVLENPSGERHMCYSDAILHKGKIVAICSNSDLWSWDLDEQGENPRQLLRSTINIYTGWEQYDFILAPSLNGKLLIVSPYGEGLPLRIALNRRTFRNQWNFTVHGAVVREVDIDAQSIEDVHDIGDRALFLGPNYPFFVPVSVPSGDLRRNHVYITDMSDCDVVAINLGDRELSGKATEMNYNGPSNNPYQVPIWFRPAFP